MKAFVPGRRDSTLVERRQEAVQALELKMARKAECPASVDRAVAPGQLRLIDNAEAALRRVQAGRRMSDHAQDPEFRKIECNISEQMRVMYVIQQRRPR